MSGLRKAAEMALKYFEDAYGVDVIEFEIKEVLRQALAQPPCQTGSQCVGGKCPECEQKTFVLDRGCWERGCMAYDERDGDDVIIEAKLKEKNT